MDYDRGFIGIKTVDRKHHSSMRFLIADQLLHRVLNDPKEKSALDTDCGNFAEIWCHKGKLNLRLIWLNSFPDASVSGFVQNVSVPEAKVAELLEIHTPIRYLYKPPPRSARIDIGRAEATLRRILQDKRTKRAFVKAMRDCFQWQEDTVHLFSDGNYDFFFTTESGFPKNGGLILHRGSRNRYACIYYSVHT